MKKNYLIIMIAAVMVLMLAACGSSSDTSAQETSQDSGETQEEAAEETAEPEEEAVNPYAWLGLEDMPECDYIDILATDHYYKKSRQYIDGLSYVSDEINAVDGVDTYKEDKYTLVITVDGKTTSINKDAKTYMENDMGDLAESAQEARDEARENGTNMIGRSFKETGSGTIPVYSDVEGDKDEYEYYEYTYPDFEETGDNSETERFYMKDGDVFAIYAKISLGETVVETTEVIDSMSGDIPDGTFNLPDLSDYEKQEF